MSLPLTATIFTLEKQVLPDGCWMPDTRPVVAAAIAAAAHRKQQPRTIERFTVKIDGQFIRCETATRLTKILGDIQIGAKCGVFRNAGRGATIDFENA